VVFHSFHIMLDHAIVQTKQLEEVSQELVTSGNITGQGLTGSGEDQPAVLLVIEEAIAIEALNHVSNAGLRDAEIRGDIDDPGVSLGVNQFEDPLEIIFHRS